MRPDLNLRDTSDFWRELLGHRDLWLIALALAITTYLHYSTNLTLMALHNVYRSLYYLPIIYAALRFGLWGGLLTALAASLLYAPHVMLYLGALPAQATNDLMEILLFDTAGVLTGLLADAERRQRRRYQAAATQLRASYHQLEERTAAIEAMQTYIANVLASLSCGVVTLDRRGRVTTSNPVAHALLGGDPIGRPLPGPLGAAIERRLSGGEGERYFQLPLGGRPVGVHLSPLQTGDGKTLGTVVVLDDLTEVKSLEEQVRRAERLSALGTLAGGLAHEIRNPLGIIGASAQMLQDELADAQTREYATVIRAESERIERLVQQLLNYARSEEAERQPLELSSLVGEVAALMEPYATQSGVNIAVESEGEPVRVDGNREKLRQGLINLTLNAIQSMPGGGRLRLTVARREGAACIEVCDQGEGIPPAARPHIFDPFFSTRDGGTGLGLAIVQRIVADHGGRIEVDSAVGCGTTFRLWLPVTREG